MKRISAIVFNYFETSHLPETLNSLYWCDEILLVTDKFKYPDFPYFFEFYNIKILHHPYSDFTTLQKYAVEKSTHDLVLVLNSNELVSDQLMKEIIDELIVPGDTHGYMIGTSSFFMGKEMKYGKPGKKKALRIFNKKWVTFSLKSTRDNIVLYGDSRVFKGKIIKKSAENIHEYISKLNLESTLQLESNKRILKKRVPVYFLTALLPLYFVYDFILNRNFLNRKYGFYLSVLNVYAFFLNQLKSNKIYRNLYRATEKDLNPPVPDPEQFVHEESIPILYSEN